MEVNKYEYKIEMAYKKAIEEFKNAESKVDLAASVNNVISFFERFIPDFFSYEGEANNIKDMYAKLKDLDYARNRVIPFIDVNLGSHVYMDYYTGMREFMESLINAVRNNDTEKLEKMRQQIDIAQNGDEYFVNSIFGGKNNEEKTETIKDAVSNVEFLIDFISIIKTMKINIESAFCNMGEYYENPMVRSMTLLMVESMTRYCYRTLVTIIDTYNHIKDTLNGVERPVAESVTFKLF